MSVGTRESFVHLRVAYLVLLAGIGVTAGLIGLSYWYWQAERKNEVTSQKSLSDTNARLASAKRERDDLRDSEATFKMLTARGLFWPERRLDLIEGLEALKLRHRLTSLTYDLSDQRPLKLAGGTTLAGVKPLATRIKIRVEAFHDGDLLAFLDDFPRFQRGMFPMDRCTLKRATSTATLSAAAPPSAGGEPQMPLGGVDAECTLEWITLVDPRPMDGVQRPPPPPPPSVRGKK